MVRLMKVLLAVMAILALALGTQTPAQAQDTVTKTFKLTLYGEGPGRGFPGFSLNSTADRRAFCGGFPGDVPCKGGGAVYTVQVDVPKGTTLTYYVDVSKNPDPPDETRGSITTHLICGSEKLTADRTNEAWYDFDTGMGGAGKGPGDAQQDDQQSGGVHEPVTKTFRATLYGTVPADTALRGERLESTGDSRLILGEFTICGSDLYGRVERTCPRGGGVVAEDVEVQSGCNFDFWVQVESGNDGATLLEVTENITEDTTNDVWYDFDTKTGGAGTGPGDVQDDQQDTGAGDDKQVPDNQQGGGKGTGAGDDQQGGVKPAAPDNQQGGSQTVTKTFELTLNGTMPEADAYYVAYAEADRVGSEASIIVLCGEPGFESTPGEAACEGDGKVYTGTAEFPEGTEIEYGFFRKQAADAEAERFHSGTETLDADMTNTAWYTFGGGSDDVKQDDDDKDTGTGAGDDRQDEMPEELPDTGAGGLARGATLPLSNAAAGLTMLMGAGYTVLRRC
jgi:hypothetical protein